MNTEFLRTLIAVAMLATGAATAQVSFTGVYAEDFNTMGTSGTTAPAGWSFYGNTGGSSSTWTGSIPASDAGLGTANPILVPATTFGGASGTEGYNFADAFSTDDRMLGTSPTGVRGVALQLSLTNDTGAAIGNIQLGFDIRRFTSSGGDNQLPGYWLFHSLDGGSTWTNVPALNSSIADVPNSIGITHVPGTGVVLGGSWADGADLLLRWVDDNAQTHSPDQIVGLDNVRISSVPLIPSTWIAKDSDWFFLDDGSDQGTAWRAAGFDDGLWDDGPAELGYGNSPATLLGFGPDANSKYVTSYFRRDFTVGNPASVHSLDLRIVRDDGAVIYLNGTEIARSNMAGGTVLHDTLAPGAAVGGANESTYFPVVFSTDPLPLLVAGTNVLAVEVHQQAVDSSDLSFNLELTSQSVPIGDPPAVAITAPAGGSIFTQPAMVNITASASDTDGTISKVEFFVGATKIGEDPVAPYESVLAGLTAGNYTLTVSATDDDGNVITSNAVEITVNTGLSGTLERGPYLNMANENSIVVRWRSSEVIVGRVRYGLTPGNLDQTTDEAAADTNHVVRLTGLTPYTRYYYSVGSSADVLTPQAAETTSYSPGAAVPTAADYTFRTSPVPGTAVDTRIWVVGDCGRGTQVQADGRDAYYAFTGSRIPDLNLQMGDNAYNNGTDPEYQTGYFNMYHNIFRKMPQWSTLGNHDADNGNTNPGVNHPYFDMFTFPEAGECGGVASGTEHYYSFDYGNIHFICLDSQASDTTVDNLATPGTNEDGPMALWLRQDLASTTATWIIGFWHHPPYSKGSHNSDSSTQLVNMRTRFNPIMEEGGVDVVFSGHSHNYERSFLLDGHYETSGMLTAAMKKDAGNGSLTGFTTRAEGVIRNAANGFAATPTVNGTFIPADGAYMKPLTGPRDHFGAVYNTAGMSGLANTGNAINHAAMYVCYNLVGTVNLDINGNTLTATFIQSDGSRPDNFTIIKQGAADTDGDGMPDAFEIANGLDRYNNDAGISTGDSDGLINLLEFAFGLNPNLNDGFPVDFDLPGGLLNERGIPAIWYQAGMVGTDFRAVYLRRKDAAESGLTYTPQFSGNLGVWEDGAAVPQVISDDGEMELVSVNYPLFVAGDEARFFRIFVSGGN